MAVAKAAMIPTKLSRSSSNSRALSIATPIWLPMEVSSSLSRGATRWSWRVMTSITPSTLPFDLKGTLM